MTACGPAGDESPSGAAPFHGRYVATDVQADGRPRPLVAGTEFRLTLDGDRLSAHAGCNSIGGRYTITDNTLRAADLAITEMGCDPARHAQDEWVVALLSTDPTLETTGDGFILHAPTTDVTFVEWTRLHPDRSLATTRWIVDGYIDGTGPDAAVASPMAGGALAMIVFETNGFLTGHDGCNTFGYAGEAGRPASAGLRYDVEGGDTIRFSGDAVVTDMACPDVDTDRFWQVVKGTVHFAIDGDELTLRVPAGRGLVLRASG